MTPIDESQKPPPNPQPGRPGADEFQPQRLRSLTEMRRSTSDRYLGGVCAGAARYLNLDPTVLRVLFALTVIVGGGGLVLYAAAWLLLPSDSSSSYAARWFDLGSNEPNVRKFGLAITAVFTAITFLGGMWPTWSFAFWEWWVLPTVVLLGVLGVLSAGRGMNSGAPVPSRPGQPGTAPAQRLNHEQETTESEFWLPAVPDSQQVPAVPDSHGPGGGDMPSSVAETSIPRRPRRSPALPIFAISLIAIALPVTYFVTASSSAMLYVAVALTAVGVACLIGTVAGEASWLYPLGAALAAVLFFGSVIGGFGHAGSTLYAPQNAGDVSPTYRQDLGEFVLDLRDVEDPQDLRGRVIDVTTGVGATKVILPPNFDAVIRTKIGAGDLRVLDQQTAGLNAKLSVFDEAEDTDQPVELNVAHRLGSVEVMYR